MTHSLSSIGSFVTVGKLNDFVRMAAQELQGFAQLCNPPTGEALGLKRGSTMSMTFYGNLSRTGGVLVENEDIKTGSITPVQVSYTLQEYGNATDWTGLLEELAELDVESSFMTALMDDMRKVQNTAAFNEFDATKWIATFNSTADEFRTDGVAASFTNVANEQLSRDNLRFLVRQARNRLIPYFDGESYVAVTGVTSSDALRYDTNIQTPLREESGRSALNGEIGRIVQTRIIEDNHVITAVGGAATGDGLLLDKTYLIGGDAVLNEYALPPEIRAEDSNFGRMTKVAWYFIASWKKIYSQDTNSKEHVIKVVSK